MRYTNKKILKITFPVLVCLLMEQLIGLTDTAYLGRVGEAELGASALAGIFYLMIFMLASGSASAPRFSSPAATEPRSIRKSGHCSCRARRFCC